MSDAHVNTGAAGDARVTLLLATTNRGKLAELRALLGDLPVDLRTLTEALPGRPQIVESGATLEENALLKARDAAVASGLLTLAEDTGLEVDALGGRPGVRSARFAGESATSEENSAALLDALAEVDDAHRTARFRCVLVMIDPEGGGEPVMTEGRCKGSIARERRGAGGFGYDPLFIVRDQAGLPGPQGGATERTMAELSDAEKNAVSHRGRAVSAMRPMLEAVIAQRLTRR